MTVQRMAAREGSDAEGEKSRSVESFCAKLLALASGIPQRSMTLFCCVDLAATRRQTIAAVHCSFPSSSEKRTSRYCVFRRAKKKES